MPLVVSLCSGISTKDFLINVSPQTILFLQCVNYCPGFSCVFLRMRLLETDETLMYHQHAFLSSLQLDACVHLQFDLRKQRPHFNELNCGILFHSIDQIVMMLVFQLPFWLVDGLKQVKNHISPCLAHSFKHINAFIQNRTAIF